VTCEQCGLLDEEVIERFPDDARLWAGFDAALPFRLPFSRFERFAEVREDLPDRSRFADRKSAAPGGCQECEGQGWFLTWKAA
jgi:hypothetical protein